MSAPSPAAIRQARPCGAVDALTQQAIDRAAPLARAASERALAAGRPAEAAYLAHLEGCIGWCPECRDLLKAVDVEDGKRLGWPDGWQEREAARR
jgi:hypothetical protein